MHSKKTKLKKSRLSAFFKISALGLLASLPALPSLATRLLEQEGARKGYRVEQFRIHARDGTRLSSVAYVPEGEGPFPAIIMVHSWFFCRWQCHLYAPYFASDGYIVLAYDCRGWGTSGGQLHIADPEHELADLEDVLDWLTEESGLPLDKNAIGVTGISYGGGHSYLIASRDERVKTAVPMNGWTDLENSINPNGSLKIAWGAFLVATATWATKLDPRNDLYRWVYTLLLKRDNYREFEEDMRGRSAIYHERPKCPMFIFCAWNDDLFEPNQNLKYFERLDQPKMLYIGNGFHGSDAGVGPRLWGRELWALVKRWFDYWLKGVENGVLSEPQVRIFRPWKGEVEAEETWPPPDVKYHTLYPKRSNGEFRIASRHEGERGLATLTPQLIPNITSGPSIVRLEAMGLHMPGPLKDAGNGFFSFTTSPSKRDYELLGIPKLHLTLIPLAKRLQVNAILYDVPSEGLPRVITYGTISLDNVIIGTEIAADMELVAGDYLIPKGNRIRLTLSGSNLPFALPVLGKGTQIVYGDGATNLMLPLRAV
jgi:predicted acyl esterase